jgi:N-acylneuraminate cytidylyltransferase
MANIAIIPARGGSKRIPRKNIKNFLGRPILSYAIETALASGLFDNVMVSTDDQEIAEVARKWGASVPCMRTDKNADDHAGTTDVIKEVLGYYKAKKIQFDYVCCIYPTAVLVKIGQLHRGFRKICEGSLDVVFPVIPFGYPVQRGLSIDKQGVVSLEWPEYANSRSQDLKTLYHDAGQWYWIRTSVIDHISFANNQGCIILDQIEAQDIDNPSDWIMAELKYKLNLEQ